jgi:serine/threonine-protein kinase
MGEVYRAHDTRLGRDVAIKCLLSEAAGDPRRRERFALEARAVSRLAHPHICTLHDLVTEGDRLFLVMEYLEGETLAQRLDRTTREQGLALADALDIATQVADALGFAHRQQIVHRDVKPANILLTRTGAKLLDFGLAKLRESDERAAEAPTKTGLTEAHTTMGTLPYMAPEQLDGQTDARSDIFAFGAVLFEMIVGRRAFQGSTPSTVVAAIVSHDPTANTPEWQDVPEALARVIRRCLSKDPELRWQSAADLADELGWISQSHRSSSVKGQTGVTRSTFGEASASPRRRTVAWWSAAALALAIAGGFIGFRLARSTPARPDAPQGSTQRVTLSLPASAPVGEDLALSPDGQVVVYVSPMSSGRPSRLYLRPMNAFEPRPLEGTDGASGPFFSPDGRSVAFFANGTLKRIALADSSVSTICNVPEGPGSTGAWGPDDTIVFGAPTSERSGLFRVQASGGAPTVLTTPDADEGGSHTTPSFVSGLRAVFYATTRTRTGMQASVKLLSLDTGQSVNVSSRSDGLFQAFRPVYAPSGHLVYGRGRTVFAAAFDLATAAVTGPSVPVVENVLWNGYAISSMGRMVFVQETDRGGRLVWVNRDGSSEVLLDDGRVFQLPRLSADGRVLAAQIVRESRVDIGLLRFENRGLTRLTTDGASNSPTWSPDVTKVVYRGLGRLLIQPIDGSQPAQVFLESKDPRLHDTSSLAPGAFTPDGSAYVFVVHGSANTGSDIWKLELNGERRAIPIVQRPRDQWGVRISPDGRWISYASNESGQFEIYIEPLSGGGAKHMVSKDGGREAVWVPAGGELFYRVGDRMMAVPIRDDHNTPVGEPKLLFTGRYDQSDLPHYDVTRDGKRFVMIQGADAGRSIQVIDNWFATAR